MILHSCIHRLQLGYINDLVGQQRFLFSSVFLILMTQPEA